MDEDKRLVHASYWEGLAVGKTGSCSGGQSHLSKSLTQFSADGWGCVPSADGIPTELFQSLKDDAAKVLHSICQQIWKTQQWPQDWKKSVFTPIPKKGSAKEHANYCTIPL